MNTTLLHDAGAPVIDAMRDASKSVGSIIPSSVHRLHIPQVPVHVPKRRPRRRHFRNLAIIGVIGVVLAAVAVMRRREPPPID
jgi:hypothetical protein